MEEVKTNAGQGLGIAGLILGIVAIPLALTGCISMLGLFLGITGIVLSAVGLSQATRANGSKGMPTGGLVVSIVGTFIALLWIGIFAGMLKEGGKFWAREGVHILNQLDEEFGEDLEEAFDDLGEDLEDIGEDLEDKLEDLEYDITIRIESGKDYTRDELEEFIDVYEELIDDYQKAVENAVDGSVEAIAESAKMGVRVEEMAGEIEQNIDEFSAELRERFEKLHAKYEKALEKAEENQQ